MALKGSRELRARLRALRTAFKPAGKKWADETVRQAQRRVPVRTGRLRRSIRVRNASMRKASVVAHFSANFVDAGTRAHDILPRKKRSLAWRDGGRTIFSKKVHHPRTRAQPFKREAALAAMRTNPLAGAIAEAWNRAA